MKSNTSKDRANRKTASAALAVAIICSGLPTAHAQTSIAIEQTPLMSASMTGGVGFALVHPAQARIEDVQFLEDDGASNRIDFSGKLRMLSQRIPAAACNLAAGIDTQTSAAVLNSAAAEFDQIVNALEFGDESLGIIGVEERRKTLVGLRKLRESWEPMFAEAQQIADGNGSADIVMAMADHSAEVLRIAVLLVSEISGQYSNPTAVLQIDALTIDIAGRQRMLSQRISKNICLVASGVNADVAMDELASAAQAFETSLDALRNGMPDAGIKSPPNTDVANGLEVVVEDWANLKPIVTQILAGETIDDEQRSIAFNGANAMTGNMNKVVGMYSQASKQDL